MTDWALVARLLRLPYGWKVRAKERDGVWTITAYGNAMLPCGHASVSVSRARSEAVAVAWLADRIHMHRDLGV